MFSVMYLKNTITSMYHNVDKGRHQRAIINHIRIGYSWFDVVDAYRIQLKNLVKATLL